MVAGSSPTATTKFNITTVRHAKNCLGVLHICPKIWYLKQQGVLHEQREESRLRRVRQSTTVNENFAAPELDRDYRTKFYLAHW